MKSSFKIISKILVLFIFLCVTPFVKGWKHTFSDSGNWLNVLVYHQKTLDHSISLKKQLNVLSYNSNITIPEDEIDVETTQENPVTVPKVPDKNDEKSVNQKKVYIYNSHQEEAYADGKTVMDAAVILGKALEDKGIKVVLETNSFKDYRNANGMDYNKSYVASYKFLNEALVNYGGFDLCIDLHRDSVPRENSFINVENTPYAYAMMVVGGLGKNAEQVTSTSTTLTDIINAHKSGIMKSVMSIEAYFNQEVHEQVVLMEVGSDASTFEEVSNSLQVISDGLYELLEKR